MVEQNTNFTYIDSKNLFIGEPNPSWFGNPPNDINNQKWTNKNWLKARLHFKPDDPAQQFGIIILMNDDLVQPDRGFATHGHQNMEICTYIVRGELTHKDSMGTQETLGRGSIQYMTAGSGVQHSEHNLNIEKDLRFIQIWMKTRQKQLPPNYGSYVSTKENQNNRQNKFELIVTDTQNKLKEQIPIKINQDANIYISLFDQQVQFQVQENRQAYILQIEGDSICKYDMNKNQQLSEQDSAKIIGPAELKFEPTSKTSHILIVEMKKQ